MSQKNKDQSPANYFEKPFIPMGLNALYNKDIKVYWIDEQIIDEDTFEYTFEKKMPDYAPMHIPKVCRFLYSHDGEVPEDFDGVGDCENMTTVMGEYVTGGGGYVEGKVIISVVVGPTGSATTYEIITKAPEYGPISFRHKVYYEFTCNDPPCPIGTVESYVRTSPGTFIADWPGPFGVFGGNQYVHSSGLRPDGTITSGAMQYSVTRMCI